MASGDVWQDGDIVKRAELDENNLSYWIKLM